MCELRVKIPLKYRSVDDFPIRFHRSIGGLNRRLDPRIDTMELLDGFGTGQRAEA